MRDFNSLKIAVAGTGYVGLSIATLLSQHHEVHAVDIVPEKVDLINNKKSPICSSGQNWMYSRLCFWKKQICGLSDFSGCLFI